MLISLLAMFVMSITMGYRAIEAEVPVVLGSPTTLEMGLVGAGVILAYALMTRTLGQRRTPPRITTQETQLSATARPVATSEKVAEQTPSRGAA